MRAFLAVIATVLLAAVSGCSNTAAASDTYSAPTAKVGESLAVSGWNVSVSNVRFEADHVLVDVDAAHSGDGEPVKAESLRFGLYGALVHPIETNGLGSCRNVDDLTVSPLSAPGPDRLTGTVCLGPQRDQNQVRGVYVYSPQDRMPGTTVAYAAAFPVGLLPTTDTETGLTLKSTSVEAFRADGAQLTQSALGDPEAFTGDGYLLLGLDINGLASRYRDDSARRGGPLMVVIAPSLPGKGLSYACSAYGASVLVLPDASRDAVAMRASLCSQGEINSAVLFASVSVIGTHAALWTLDD